MRERERAMTITDVAPPPLYLCANVSATVAVWLCENRHWPVVHTVFPLILYLYTRDFKFSFLLVFAFESIEAVLEVFWSTVVLDTATESLGDSLISDPLMGLLGILIAMVWVRIFEYRYRPLTPFYKGSEVFWAYYLIQFVGLAFPTALLYSFPSSINGIISIVYVMMVFWIPILYYAFAVLEKNNIHWIPHLESVGDRYTVIFDPVQKVKHSPYMTFHGWTAFLLFVYLGSFVYRYTSVFVMACIHNGALLLILSIYGFATGRLINRKKQVN